MTSRLLLSARFIKTFSRSAALLVTLTLSGLSQFALGQQTLGSIEGTVTAKGFSQWLGDQQQRWCSKVGQPYNVYDFSGSVGSLYYSANDFTTNPVVPLAPGFNPITAQTHGNPGATPPVPSLNPNAFAIPQLSPGRPSIPGRRPTRLQV